MAFLQLGSIAHNTGIILCDVTSGLRSAQSEIQMICKEETLCLHFVSSAATAHACVDYFGVCAVGSGGCGC